MFWFSFLSILLTLIFFIYIAYRWFTIFSSSSSSLILRNKNPKINLKDSQLADGSFVESELFNPESKTPYLFFAVNTFLKEKTHLDELPKAVTKLGHVSFTWTLRNCPPNAIDNKFRTETFVKDINDLVYALKIKFPKKKFIFVGNEFGSMLLTAYMKKYPSVNRDADYILLDLFPSKKSLIRHNIHSSSSNWFAIFVGIYFFQRNWIELKKESTLTKNSFPLKNVPFFFLCNFFWLRFQLIKNLLQNKHSSVWLFLSLKDKTSKIRFELLQEKFKVTNPKIKILSKQQLDLPSVQAAIYSEKFFTGLISKFLQSKNSL